MAETGKTKKTWTIRAFIEGFVKNTLGKKKIESNYRVGKRDDGTSALVANCLGEHDVLAVRIKGGVVLGNAERMKGVGAHMAWGNLSHNWQPQVKQQRWLQEAGAIMIPFNVIRQLGLEPNNVVIVARGPEERLRRKASEEVMEYTVERRSNLEGAVRTTPLDDKDFISIRLPSGDVEEYTIIKREDVQDFQSDRRYTLVIETHFVGAILFRCGEKDMLFDVDREELKHDIFNPFVVALPRKCESIEDAYASLMPEQVKQAIAEGKDVKRQGEWYFIPKDYKPREDRPTPEGIVLTPPPMPSKEFVIECAKQGESVIPGSTVRAYRLGGELEKAADAYNKQVEDWQFGIKNQFDVLQDSEAKSGQLRQGNSRPNTVEKFVKAGEEVFVMGEVSHSGREHRDLMLNKWHVAIPNAAVSSWQVSGDVD